MQGFAGNFLAGHMGARQQMRADEQQQNANALAPLQRQAMQLGMDQTRQGMAIDQERLAMARQASAREAEKFAMAVDAQELARVEAETRAMNQRLIPLYEAGDPEAFNAAAAQLGAQITFDEFPVDIAADEAAFEVWKNFREMSSPQQEGFRPATPEEAAQYGAQAGQFDTKTGRFYENSPAKGMKITSDGRGGFTLTEGPGVGAQDGRPKPSDPNLMISSIDGILNDPALDMSTGLLSPLQGIPGTPQRRVGSRIDQLNGQAFLQAFESLKGAGQITEIEGTKATQAIGRLDSAQSPADYRAALTELRGILSEAATRPEGWVDSAQRRQVAPFSAQEANAMTPEQILSMGPDALTRFPVGQLDWTDAQWDALEALAAQEEARRGAR